MCRTCFIPGIASLGILIQHHRLLSIYLLFSRLLLGSVQSESLESKCRCPGLPTVSTISLHLYGTQAKQFFTASILQRMIYGGLSSLKTSATAHSDWFLLISGLSRGGACAGMTSLPGARRALLAADSNLPAGALALNQRRNVGFVSALAVDESFSAVLGGPRRRGRLVQGERMALSTTVSRSKCIKRKAPRGFLKRFFKRQKPHLRLESSCDLLVRFSAFWGLKWGRDRPGRVNRSLFCHPQTIQFFRACV